MTEKHTQRRVFRGWRLRTWCVIALICCSLILLSALCFARARATEEKQRATEENQRATEEKQRVTEEKQRVTEEKQKSNIES